MKIAAIALICLTCAAARAQLQVAPAAQQPTGASQKLVPVGADGRIEALDGFVELRAIKVSTALDDEAREKVKPQAREWLLDVQQQVIDNLDFVLMIEPLDGSPGYLDQINPQDVKSFERVGTFSRQLNSPGSLLARLVNRRVIALDVERQVRQSMYEYDMVLLRQATDNGKDMVASTRHQYRNAYRDAIQMYHSLQDRAAGNIDEAVAVLGAEQAAAVAPAVAAIKGAKGKAEARAAVRGLLKGLSHAQRRAFLLKVRDIAPISDPFEMA